MTSLADLARRLSRKVETQRSIRLSAEDLNMIVKSGAFAAVQNAATEELKERCPPKAVTSPYTAVGNTGSIAGQGERTSKSSGMMQPQNASEALARAQAMLNKPS